MLRENRLTAPTRFETPNGLFQAGGNRGRPNTRRKFPQISGDLAVRWCSSYLKIHVMDIAICNQPRFNGKRLLTISGERAEESPNRARYAPLERGRNHSGVRHEDRWRPVHQWPESKVWEIIKRHGINPHPAYRLGWGRLSCFYCIFGSKNQWATGRLIDPGGFRRIRDYEADFGITIRRNHTPIDSFADMGIAYPNLDPRDIATAMSETFNEPIILPPGQWRLPRGAFGEQAGPT